MAVITFLGTGGDAYVVGKQLRSAGGIIVEISGNQFHLDPGPGALAAAKEHGIDVRKSVAILATHGHMNHCYDVGAVLSAMTYGGLDPHGVVLASESVVNGTESTPKRLNDFDAQCAEKVVSLKDTPRVGINDVDIRVTPAQHTDESAVGFILSNDRESVGYTGDTGLTKDVIDAYSGVDTLIVCMQRTDEQESDYHLDPAEVVELANLCKPTTLILTHFSQPLLKQNVRSIGRSISQEVDCHVIVAEDGSSLDTKMYR